jgi:hypothetical protein
MQGREPTMETSEPVRPPQNGILAAQRLNICGGKPVNCERKAFSWRMSCLKRRMTTLRKIAAGTTDNAKIIKIPKQARCHSET